MGFSLAIKKGKERKNKIKMKKLNRYVFRIKTGDFLDMNITYFRPRNKSGAILMTIATYLFIGFYES